MKGKYQKLGIAAFISLLVSPTALANDWVVRPYIGMSIMSDLSGQAEQVETQSGAVDVNLDSGFTAGLGLGYQFSKQWLVELAWEYRTNDSEVTLPDGDTFTDGNYASNLFFLNGIYQFNTSSPWSPYLGAGISWAQEIDIDLERDGMEQSFSGDGEFGYQVFAGTNYALSENWAAQFEVRYGSIGDIPLEAEGTPGRITGLDYKTTTVQLGLAYRF